MHKREPWATHRSRQRSSRAAACSTRSDAASRPSLSSPRQPAAECARSEPERVPSRASKHARTQAYYDLGAHAGGCATQCVTKTRTESERVAGARRVPRMMVTTRDYARNFCARGSDIEQCETHEPNSLGDSLSSARSISALPGRAGTKKVLACSSAPQHVGRALVCWNHGVDAGRRESLKLRGFFPRKKKKERELEHL